MTLIRISHNIYSQHKYFQVELQILQHFDAALQSGQQSLEETETVNCQYFTVPQPFQLEFLGIQSTPVQNK